jgi:hypothetical protein
MSRLGTFYGIFMGGPSDIEKEKELTRNIIQEWNIGHSKGLGIILEAISWDSHVTPDMGNPPQTIINKQIDDCDIAICFFGTRLGTPTSREISGTVEEIKKFTDENKPVLIYFSKMDIPQDTFDPDQFQELKKFKEECKNQGVLREYKDLDDLKGLLRKHIPSTVLRLDKEKQKIQTYQGHEDVSRKEQLSYLYHKLCFYHQKLDLEFDIADFKAKPYAYLYNLSSVKPPVSKEERLYDLLEEIDNGLWEIVEYLYEPKFEETRIKIKDTIVKVKNMMKLFREGDIPSLPSLMYDDENIKKFENLKKYREEIVNSILSAVVLFHESIDNL